MLPVSTHPQHNYVFVKYEENWQPRTTLILGYFDISDYKEDPYSEHNPCSSICCRGDLMSVNPGPFGCYDTKVCISLVLFWKPF